MPSLPSRRRSALDPATSPPALVTWLLACGGFGEGGQREVRPRRAPSFLGVVGGMVVWSSTRGYGQPHFVQRLPRRSRILFDSRCFLNKLGKIKEQGLGRFRGVHSTSTVKTTYCNYSEQLHHE